MIDTALTHITEQLNLSLKRQFMLGEDKLVVMSNLHEQDGTVPTQVADKVSVFLVNVERETVVNGRPSASRAPRLAVTPEPVHLNLMVMFAANFKNYVEALKLLSSTVAFFQGRPVFNHQNTPDLDPRLVKLTMEIENLSIADLSNLWGMLSGKYLPSVLYRMRMLSIDSDQLTAQVPRVLQPEARAVG